MLLDDAESTALLAGKGALPADAATRALGDAGADGTLAISLDRDRRGHVVRLARIAGAGIAGSRIAGARIDGAGIDGSRLAHFVEPATALPGFLARRAAQYLGYSGEAAQLSARALAASYALVLDDAFSVEARLCQGRITGARVVLDATARFRHPEWAPYGERLEGTAEEAPFRRIGAVACVPDPGAKIVAVLSGAGLMMTTLDMLTARGARVRCVIDMQGLPLQGVEGMAPIFELVGRMKPAVTLIGGRFMAPVAHEFAAAVIAANRKAPLTGQVITWLAGNRAEDGQILFAEAGFRRVDDYPAAIAATVSAGA